MIPVLLLSATYLNDQSRVEALEREADGYLTEPVEPPVLLAYVEALLRTQAEEALRLSEQRLALALEAGGAGVYDHHVPIGPELYHSKHWADILGYTLEELPPYDQFLEWLDRQVHPDDRPRLWQAYSDFIEGRTPAYDVEIRMKHKSGDWVYVKGLSKAVTRDEHGRVTHVVGVMLDITERKRAEEELRRAHAELERRVEERTRELSKATRALREQIAEREQAEEALRRSLERVDHSRRLLLTLSQAAQAVQRARTPMEVYQTMGDELTRLGYHTVVFGLTDDRAHLGVHYVSFEPARVQAAEKLTGLSVQDFRWPLAPVGLMQRVLTEGETIFAPGGKMPGEAPAAVQPLVGRLRALLGLAQSIIAPLTIDGEAYGLMVVNGAGLTEDDVPAITAFANQTAIALKNARLYEEIQQKLEELELLLDSVTTVSSTLELDRILARLAEKMATSAGAAFCRIALLAETGDTLTTQAFFPMRDLDWDPGLGRHFALADAPRHRQVIQTGKTMVLHRDDPSQAVSEVECRIALSEGIKSALLIPLITGDRTLGVVSLGEMRSRERTPFTPDRVRLCRAIADQAATAIENARLFEQAQAGRQQLRDLAHYLQTAREAERVNIAREIHDELGRALMELKVDLAWLTRHLPADQPDLAHSARRMSDIIAKTSETVARIATELRPRILDEMGLAAAIEWQAGEFAERTGVECDVHLSHEEIDVDRDMAVAVFRIFQEALTNVARHAGATRVHVDLLHSPDELVLSISDDGRGITEEQVFAPGSLGLLGMRERADACGGSITFQGFPGQGTAVTLRMPVPAGRGTGG